MTFKSYSNRGPTSSEILKKNFQQKFSKRALLHHRFFSSGVWVDSHMITFAPTSACVMDNVRSFECSVWSNRIIHFSLNQIFYEMLCMKVIFTTWRIHDWSFQSQISVRSCCLRSVFHELPTRLAGLAQTCSDRNSKRNHFFCVCFWMEKPTREADLSVLTKPTWMPQILL